MDELLHRPSPASGQWRERPQEREDGAAVSAAPLLEGAASGARTLRRNVDLARESVANLRTSPLLFLPVALLLSFLLIAASVYTTAYTVTLNGQVLGSVADTQEVDEVIDRVESLASQVLGYSYTLKGTVLYNRSIVKQDEIVEAKSLEQSFFESVDEVMNSYVLRVNGEVVGSWADSAELETMLEQVKSLYMTENTVSASFADTVDVSYEMIASASGEDLDHMYSTLTSTISGDTTYEVVAGDTLSAIAFNHDMPLSTLLTLNPDVTVDKLQIGQIINIKEVVPFLSVETVDEISYTAEVAAPIEQVEDSSMYVGESKVLTEGSAGLAEYEASVRYRNGVEQERSIISEQVLVEPVTEVVAVGTTERPKTMATGTFAWPTSGNITSYFGGRYIFGSYSFHRGIDIANSYGTRVLASDGGVVVSAKYDGTYGYIIVIDHENGYQTAYAHCSSFAVGVGTRVYQGQVIAYTGSTGRATGNHLHFEVRINGTQVNPLSYLK